MTLQELLVKIGADISGYTQGVDQVIGKSGDLGNALDRTVNSTDAVMASLDKLGSSLTRLGAGMTAAITLPIVGVSVAALKLSSDLEQARIAFTTMMGSADMAKAHLESLRDFAMKTPFEFTDLVQASKRLQALGFTAQQVIPTLTAVGDAASALGGGAQSIERITLALGQMQAKGKVSAEEIRQLAEAGIPAWQMLADAISKTQGKAVTVGEAMKMAEKGMLDGTAAVQVLLEGMEKKFGGLMDAQAKTIGGMFSNLKDQSAKVLVQIGDTLAPIGKRLIESMTGVLGSIETVVQKFKALPEPIQEFILMLTGVAVAAGPAVLAFGTVAAAASSAFKAFTAISAFASSASLFGGLGESALAAGAKVAAAGAVANAGWSAMALTIGGISLALVALGTGAVLAWSQLQRDTAGLHTLDQAFEKFLVDATKGDPSKAIDKLNDALDKGLIKLPEYDKLMKMAADNANKMAGAEMSAGLKTLGLTVDVSAVTTKPKPLINEPVAKPGAALQDAFTVFGMQDLNAAVIRYKDAYRVLESSGKATTDQLAAAWEKVTQAIDASTFKLVKWGATPVKGPFDIASLPSLDTQIGKQVDLTLKANQYKDLKAAIQDVVTQQVRLVEEEKSYLDMGFNPTAIRAGLEAQEGMITDGLAMIGMLAKESDALKVLSKQIAETPSPFPVDFLGAGEKLVDGLMKADLAAQKFALDSDGIGKALSRMHSEAFKAFDTIATSATTSLGEVEDEWAKISSEVNRLAKTNLPEAVRMQNEYIAALVRLGAAQGQLYAEQAKELALVIEEKAQRGEAANAEIIALENIRVKNDALRESTRLLGDLYVSLGHDGAQALDQLAKGFGDAIIAGNGFGDAIKSVLKNLERQVMQDLVGTAFKALKDALINNTGLVKELGNAFSSISGLFSGGAASTASRMANQLGGVESVIPGAAPAAGGAGGLLGGGGVLGAMGPISAAAGAVEGIIGIVQTHAMNKSLDLIVRHTLETTNELRNLRSDSWSRNDGLMAKLDDMWNEIRNVVMVLITMQGASNVKPWEVLNTNPVGGGLLYPVTSSTPSQAYIGTGGGASEISSGLDSGFTSVVSAVEDVNSTLTDILPAVQKLDPTLTSAFAEPGFAHFINEHPDFYQRLNESAPTSSGGLTSAFAEPGFAHFINEHPDFYQRLNEGSAATMDGLTGGYSTGRIFGTNSLEYLNAHPYDRGNVQPSKQIIIQNNSFRDEAHMDYLLNTVKNQI